MPDPRSCPVNRNLPVNVCHLGNHVASFSQPHHNPAAFIKSSARAILILQYDLHPLDAAAEPGQGKLQPSLNVGNTGCRCPTTNLFE